MWVTMCRIEVILCLMSRVISALTIHHQNVLKGPRSLPRSSRGYTAELDNQFGDSSKMYAIFADTFTEHGPFSINDPLESKPVDKMWQDAPAYPDLSSFPEMVTHRALPFTPLPKYGSDYRMATESPITILDPKYNVKRPSSSSFKSDIMLEKLKSMMLYAPPGHAMNDAFSGYDSSNDFHNDDEDVRMSGRTMYDSYWPYFYHSPYEYEPNKENFEIEKAKDKRYISSGPKRVIPVHEHIEGEVHSSEYLHIGTPKYKASTASTVDNPIGGNGPFFSFVLNDYFDKNHDDDPLTFKGVGDEWAKDFDHESYRTPEDEISKRNRRLETKAQTEPIVVLTTATPESRMNINLEAPYYPKHSSGLLKKLDTTTRGYITSQGEAAQEIGHRTNRKLHTHEKGDMSNSNDKSGQVANDHKYEGFRNFLDSFANKFGAENYRRDDSYVKRMNNDKGENKKGFRRVYHKDEFQEDKEFFDNTHGSTKSEQKGIGNAHIGGSEAVLQSHATAAQQDLSDINTKSKNTENHKHTHNKGGNSGSNSSGNSFHKYIDVAKQAARSNSADYLDNYKI